MAKSATTGYQLRIELQEVTPAVWRSVRVPASANLAKLHQILQIVMGWTNSHLHDFSIGAARYGMPEVDEDEKLLPEKRVTLSDVLTPSIRQFIYRYDFGDGWEHDVQVERTVNFEPDDLRVLCLAGANACPPEDVGGPHQYAEFLKAIGNPRHREHREYLRWCGGAFDPSGFDLQSVNQRLRRLKV